MLNSSFIAIFFLLPAVFAVLTPYKEPAGELFAANSTNKCNGTLSTFQWIHSNVHLQLPHNAVYGGYDKDRNSIYVGRALHDGVYWPASIVPAKNTAYITANGKTYTKDIFEVLTGDNFTWEMGYDGNTPSGAISFARGYWIGRASYKFALIVGQISRKKKACLISYNNKEKSNSKYQVLIYHPYSCSCQF